MASDLAHQVKATSKERQALIKVIRSTDRTKTELSQTKAKLNSAKLGLASSEQGSSILSKQSGERTKSNPGFLKKLFRQSAKPREDASQWADKADKQTKSTRHTVEELTKKCNELQAQLEERVKAEDALLGIYTTLFEGPMPEYPGKDECDAKVRGAEKALKACQEDVSHTASVSNTLYTAQMRIRNSLQNTDRALRYAVDDPIPEDNIDSKSLYEVVRGLDSAHNLGKQATELLTKAKTMDSDIEDYDQPLLIDTSPYRRNNTSTSIKDILIEMGTPIRIPADVVDARNVRTSRASLQGLNDYVDRQLVKVEEKMPRLAEARNEKQEVLDAARGDWLEFCTKLWDEIYNS